MVNRVWDEFDSQPADGRAEPATPIRRAEALRRATHRLIKAVTEAIEGFRFNSGIARLYEFLDVLQGRAGRRRAPAVLAARAEALSAPGPADRALRAAPGRGVLGAHRRRRAWSSMAPWPAFDPALAAEDERGAAGADQRQAARRDPRRRRAPTEAEVEKIALADADVQRHLEGLSVRKVIVVKDRIVNIVAG